MVDSTATVELAPVLCLLVVVVGRIGEIFPQKKRTGTGNSGAEKRTDRVD
jgi:hypothetical protein